MAIGVIGWIGLATEATPGTANATVNTFFATESYQAVQSHEPVAVEANLASLSKVGYLKGKLTPKGSLSAPLSIDNASVFYWALGTDSVVDNGDGTYTHTITPALILPTFTVHADEVIDQIEQAGGKVSKLTVSAAAGEVAKISMEWFALSHNEGVTLTETVAMPTKFVNFTEAVITIDSTTAINVDNIEFSIENNLETLFTLGTSRYPQKVMRNDRPTYSGKLVLIDWDANLYQKMINADNVAITFKFTDPDGNYVQVDLPKVQFTGGGFEPEISTGRITAEPEFEAVGDNPITVTVYTTRSEL